MPVVRCEEACLTNVRSTLLDDLRQRIRRIEGRSVGDRSASIAFPTGIDTIDRHLPAGGLERGALHEFVTGTAMERAAATGFVALLLARYSIDSALLWCLEGRDLYGPGLASLGFNPWNDAERLILVRCRNATDVLWAMEEGLASGTPTVVLGELRRMPRQAALTAHRRLQLAAERSGVTALLFVAEMGTETSTATSRWRVSPAAGVKWRIELLKCRHGQPGVWTVPAPGFLSPRLKPGFLERPQDDKGQSFTSHSRAAAAALRDRPVGARRATG